MTIQPIGNASVALYITPADLKEHGLTPAGLTLERALELTRDAFHEAGITLDGSIEIEAYPNACGVLVFARVQAPEHLWFSFDSLTRCSPPPARCRFPGRTRSFCGGRGATGSHCPPARIRLRHSFRNSAARRMAALTWRPALPSTAVPSFPGTRSALCSPISPSSILTSML